MRHGKGLILYKTIGICHYNNGDTYDGDWKEDIKEGNGIFYI